MLNQWHGRIVWFPLGLNMWATVLRLFGCLASLDGSLVQTRSFLKLVWVHPLRALLEPSLLNGTRSSMDQLMFLGCCCVPITLSPCRFFGAEILPVMSRQIMVPALCWAESSKTEICLAVIYDKKVKHNSTINLTATPCPPSSLVSLFAIPFTMKTPCVLQQGMNLLCFL